MKMLPPLTDAEVEANLERFVTHVDDVVVETRRTRQFHLQGQHDQQTHGRRYGATRALSEPDGGFTLSAIDLTPMRTGWAVALKGTDRLLLAADSFDADGNPTRELVRLTRERLDAARSSTAPDGTEMALGGWHNPADGKVEVNVTVVFPSGDEATARQFAQDNDQIAMANLDAIAAGDWDNAIVDTGGTGGDRDLDRKLATQFHLQGQHDQQSHGNRVATHTMWKDPGEVRERVTGSPNTIVRFTDSRGVGAALRKAGFGATRSEGTRIRGAPQVKPGYEASKYKLLDFPDQVVKVTWQNAWHVDPANQPDPSEQTTKMAQALIDEGYVVTWETEGGQLFVWGRKS